MSLACCKFITDMTGITLTRLIRQYVVITDMTGITLTRLIRQYAFQVEIHR